MSAIESKDSHAIGGGFCTRLFLLCQLGYHSSRGTEPDRNILVCSRFQGSVRDVWQQKALDGDNVAAL